MAQEEPAKGELDLTDFRLQIEHMMRDGSVKTLACNVLGLDQMPAIIDSMPPRSTRGRI
jgi:signal recognition particle GTPase